MFNIKDIYEDIFFENEFKFKKMFSRYFNLEKEENLNNCESLSNLSDQYYWRKVNVKKKH